MMPISEVFNEDNMVGMARYPDGFFDLILTDIQYGIGVGKMAYLTEMNTYVKQKNGTRLNGNRNKKPYVKKEWDDAPPPQEYFDEVCRVSKNQIIFGVDYVDWMGLGKGRIKWDKGVAEGMSFNRHEVAYCSFIDYEITLPLLWAGMCQAKSLAEPMTQQGNKKKNEKRIHPTQKPVLLFKRILQLFSQKGFKIGDTHMGSQSSRIACWDGGFDYWGWEIDKDYFGDGCKRFDTHILQTRLF